MARKTVQTETTLLDDDVTKPSVTAPGDGPADTTDPTERATSVSPRPGEEAKRVGTVNAVEKLPDVTEVVEDEDREDRVEEYDVTAPDGSKVRVRHNLDTGHTEKA
jgi:hypothetical protein